MAHFAHLNCEEVKSQLERDTQSVGGHLAHLTLRKKNDDAEFKSFCSQQVSKSVTRFSEYPAQYTAAGKSFRQTLSVT